MNPYETGDAREGPHPRVLLTGATGYIAGQLLPAFRERYDLRLIDVRDTDALGERVEGVEVVDVLSADDSVLAPFFSDAEVVVHCGHVKPEGEDSRSLYEGERRNVDMMQRVYQLALEGGVRRVVAASTNQAAKWYERPYYAGLKDRVDPEDYPRPDSFYGWAKAAYEPLGFLYACGSLGRKLEVVQIRIVVPREIDASLFEDEPPERYVRELAGYISVRDMQQLFCRSVETPEIADEHGVPFHIFYGVSDNARKFWSITNARRVIGYDPQDDSEVRFADDIARLLHGKPGDNDLQPGRPPKRGARRVITDLGHPAFAAHDVETTLNFYALLGIEESFRLHHEDGSLMLVYLHVAGDRFVEVFPGGPPPDPDRKGSFMHVCLLTEDIHATVEHLRSNGAPIDREPTVALDHNWQAWTRDPDGNEIELMQLTEESPQWRAARGGSGT